MKFFGIERRSVLRSFYDGICTFKGYMGRVHPYSSPYDWADLGNGERQKYARRAANVRNRREQERRDNNS